VGPDVGEFVKRGETVARLVDISRIKMNLHVPERDIGRFRLGQKSAVMRPEPYEGVTTGTITRIALVADDPSKTFLMEVTLDNPDGVFRPGMITKAELMRRNHSKALVIPAFSVLPTENGPIVYVEENGLTRARRVEIGIRKGMEFEISKGLKPGDRLIVAGQRNLSDGSPVRVVRESSGDIGALSMYSSDDRIPAIAGDPVTSRTESAQAGKTR
jgi:membrane fusion protein (multidrug efflux system)